MVGYRNTLTEFPDPLQEFIRLSDGGVSERISLRRNRVLGVYQAFRWWGIGTTARLSSREIPSLSGFPMVGYRNTFKLRRRMAMEFIRLSDGGVSEHYGCPHCQRNRVYQAFRWWGIGTHLG